MVVPYERGISHSRAARGVALTGFYLVENGKRQPMLLVPGNKYLNIWTKNRDNSGIIQG